MRFLLNKNIVIVLLGITFWFCACEEPVDWETQIGENEKLVVEAILTDELTTQKIRLTQSYNSLTGEALPINDAIVYINTNGVVINFLVDSLGLYKSEIEFEIINDLEYELKIEWKEKEYFATSKLSTVAPLPVVTFDSLQNSDSLVFGNFVPIYNANQQAMYEIDVDWSHLSNEGLTKAKTYFYTFNSINVSQLIPPDRERIQFPTGSIVVIKKFGLNDDFAEYLRSLVIETEWDHKVFYATPTNLPSNISNDGLGFFSTCAVLSDTLIAQ